MEEGRPEESISVIEAQLRRDDAEPVDHAWLLIQLACAMIEVGRVDEARAIVFDVQAIRTTHADDITATAFGGVAAQLLFNTSAPGMGDVGYVIASSDTTAAWWRHQTASWGLAAQSHRIFKTWARDQTITIGADDETVNRLLAASLAANHIGDQGDWRSLAGLLGEDTLMRQSRGSDPEEAYRGLATLRMAGSEASLELAVRRLVADGPAAAVTLAAADIQLNSSTRTTGPANLTLLRLGGDVLDEATADRSVAWLLNTVTDPTEFADRTTPSYLLVPKLVDTLAAVVLAASLGSQRAVVNLLMSIPEQTDQFVAMSWARVVIALPSEAWNEVGAAAAGQIADRHHESLRRPLQAVAAAHDSAVMDAIMLDLSDGSLEALTAVDDVSSLSPEVAAAVISVLVDRAQAIIDSARAGSHGFGGFDVPLGLALLNLWHPSVAQWELVLELREESAVAGNDKRGAFLVLASLEPQIPDNFRPRLKDIATKGADQALPEHSLFIGDERDAKGAAADLAAALGALDDQDAADRILDLLAGDTDHRQWAARLASRLARVEDTGVLAVLAQDIEPQVRAAAAAGLSYLVGSAQGGALALAALRRCLEDPGTLVAMAVAGAVLASSDFRGPALEVLDALADHPSALVRTRVRAFLSR